ncbi:MAG: hypothetical protein Q9180_009654, partial [Flavoplaca navasiana]
AILNTNAPGEQVYAAARFDLKARATKWQGLMYSCANQESFFPSFVAHEVTSHNVRAHIMKLVAAFWELQPTEGAPRQSAAVQELQTKLMSAAIEQAYRWFQAVQQHATMCGAEWASLKHKERSGPKGKVLDALIRQLRIDKREVGALKNRLEASTRDDNDAAPLAYYHDLSNQDRIKFWEDRLDLEVATQIWWCMNNFIPIEQNLTAPMIGPRMRKTYCTTAMAAWTYCISRRVENLDMDKYPTEKTKFIQKYPMGPRAPEALMVLKTFQDIQASDINIDDVLLPQFRGPARARGKRSAMDFETDLINYEPSAT